MNLHGIVAPVISTVNPLIPVTVFISIPPSPTNSDGSRSPAYATPGSLAGSIGGSFTASASGTVLDVSAVLTGSLQSGDQVSGTDGTNALPIGCIILKQLSGTPGAVGAYLLSEPPVTGNLQSCTVASLSTVLNATAINAGVLQIGQELADTTGALSAGTAITAQLSGASGGIGTYSLSRAQTVAAEAMTTSLVLSAQIQPLTWRDIQQLDGLNLQGTRWKIYLYGEVDGLVRQEKKGGDLVVIPPGSRHAGTWLVAQILEQFPDWVSAAITLQDGS